jgi:hypothetical protein
MRRYNIHSFNTKTNIVKLNQMENELIGNTCIL